MKLQDLIEVSDVIHCLFEFEPFLFKDFIDEVIDQILCKMQHFLSQQVA